MKMFHVQCVFEVTCFQFFVTFWMHICFCLCHFNDQRFMFQTLGIAAPFRRHPTLIFLKQSSVSFWLC